MSTDNSSPDDTPSTTNSPLLVTKRSDFQWTIVLSDSLPSGWEDHLTDYLVAEATVSLALQDEEPLILTEGKLLDDPRGLYQITSNERSVEVQSAYRALSQSFMETPYDCQLLLKTAKGGRFVTIPAPQPPNSEEWKQLVKKIWFRVVLAGGDLGVASATGGSSLKEQPLYTFKLREELAWDEAAEDSPNGPSLNEWQRELRFIVDPQQPDMVHAQLRWNDRQPISNQMMITGPMPRIEAVSKGRQKTKRRRARKKFRLANMLASLSRRNSSTYEYENHSFWSRLALATTALLLLALVAVVAIGAVKSRSEGNVPLVAFQPSPTLTLPAVPSPTSTDVPTVGSTAAPSSTPAPAPTAQHAPIPTATKRPQPTATSAPPPTPTATPSPTDTPTPSPTSTPIPIVNVVILPTISFSQTCPTLSSLSVTIDNTGSNVAITWQVNITDTDPMGIVWASASPTGGTVPAGGQSGPITITPGSTLCQDMSSGQTIPYTAVFTYSASGQSSQAITVTNTVSA